MSDFEQGFGEDYSPEGRVNSYQEELTFSLAAAQETFGIELDVSDIRLKDKEPVARSLRRILDSLLKEYATAASYHEKDAMPDEHWSREQAFFRNEALRRINIARRFFSWNIPEDKLLTAAEIIGDNYVNMDSLTPQNLVGGDFVPAEAHRIIAESLSINQDAVIPDIKTEFDKSVKDSYVTFLGMDAMPTVAGNIAGLVRSIEDTQDTVLMVPFDPTFQRSIDHFLKTGRFDEGDDPTRYQHLYEQFEGLEDIELLEGNVSEGFREVLRIFPVLQAAREKGIAVVAGDVNGDLIECEVDEDEYRRYKRSHIGQRFSQAGIEERYWDEDPARDTGMFGVIKDQISDGKKVIAITGRLDGQALFRDREIDTGYPKFLGGNMRRTKQYRPSVALLARNEWGSKARSFIFENRLDNMQYAMSGEQVSSLLFEGMKKYDSGNGSIGLHTDRGNAILNIPGVPKIVGANYYIPVYRS